MSKNFIYSDFILTKADSNEMVFTKDIAEVYLQEISDKISWIPRERTRFCFRFTENGKFHIDSFIQKNEDIVQIIFICDAETFFCKKIVLNCPTNIAEENKLILEKNFRFDILFGF